MSDRGKRPTTLPIFLGSSTAEVHQCLGEPDRTISIYGRNCENYLAAGVAIDYTEHDTVAKISASWLDIDGKTGTFTDELVGVRLGDTAESCLQKLGPPHGNREYSWSMFSTWKVADWFLEIEFWTESGNEEPWGDYHEGCVKRIVVVDHLDDEEEIENKASLLIQDMYPEVKLDQIKQTLKDM